MRKVYFLTALIFFGFAGFILAQETQEHNPSSHTLKRHKVGAFLGNSLIHGVKNTQSGKEQYVLAPTLRPGLRILASPQVGYRNLQ